VPARNLMRPLLVVGVVSAAVATVVTLAVVDSRGSGVEIGETETLKVETYFGPEGPQPNVICFDLEDLGCGLPVLADSEMKIEVGQTVTATRLLLEIDNARKRVVYFVHKE
jgi:hypothetical protein